jgi:hypothetical protein
VARRDRLLLIARELLLYIYTTKKKTLVFLLKQSGKVRSSVVVRFLKIIQHNNSAVDGLLKIIPRSELIAVVV